MFRLPHSRALHVLMPLALGILAIAVWWPAFFTTYGLADDYAFLRLWGQPDFALWHSDVVQLGRPLAALLQRGQFLLVDTLAELAVIRMINGGLLLVFAGLLYRGLRRTGWQRGVSWLATALVLFLPPFIVYLGWAVMTPAGLAAIVALWGSDYFLARAARKPAATKRVLWNAGSVATGSILIAACLYQPAAGFFLLLPLATLLARPSSKPLGVLGLGRSVIVFLGSLGLYFAGFTVAKSFFFNDALAVERSDLGADLGGKWAFLATGPLIDILGGWWTLSTAPFAHSVWIVGLVLTVAAGGALSIRFSNARERLWAAGAALGLLALTLLPVAVVAANYAPFRVLGPASAGWMLFLVGSFAGLTRSRWRYALGLGLILLVSRQAHVGLREGIVRPQQREWSTLEELLNEKLTAETRAVVYRMPVAWNRSPAIRPYHEFSYVSSASQWGLKGMFYLNRKARFPELADPDLMIFPLYPWESLPASDALLIDGYGALSRHAETPAAPPAWTDGRILELDIPPLGIVSYHGRNWISHPHLGPAWVYDLPAPDASTDPPTAAFTPEAGIRLFLISEGRTFWTKAGVYPSFVDLKANRWYYLNEAEAGQPALEPYAD